ncbi:3'-5' exonuclease [Candidatus Jorgensenbacteria bacterium]|nr:3'-5' exonuclease [Candidatus Jorgensenbacteria bacterium]
MKKEVFISVDIEADGPIPGDYSMSSLGACVVDRPDLSFYVEFRPISEKFILEVMIVSGLDRDRLVSDGEDPDSAMRRFANWIQGVCGTWGRPVFVAFNATYDWMFVHWYFEHFLGHDPFGISGWDIKAYYAGVAKKKWWSETSMRKIEEEFKSFKSLTHNALDDARCQAEIFRRLRQKVIAG